jgi:hypothetical protein
MSMVGVQVVAAGLFGKREGLGRSAGVSSSVEIDIAMRACSGGICRRGSKTGSRSMSHPFCDSRSGHCRDAC